jgi:hypothetical protein
MSEKPILLDIIFVENTYPKTQRIKLKSTLLVTEEPHTEIEAPTFESLAGDKLTAFACNTIGIPIGKNKELEIAKQLFDLGMLHGRIFSTEVVRSSFLQTAAMCITAYHKPYNPQDVYDDILSVAFTMAMNGKHNKPLFDEIKRGISGLADYLSRGTKFGYEAATIAAAKVAYLVACLMKGKEMETVAWSIDIQGDYKKRQIEHPEYGLLNKELKKRNPEAWLYWLHAVAVLAEEPTVLAEAVNGELAARGQALPMTITSVPEPPNRSTVNDLAFIVSGRPTIVSGVSGSEPLATAVQQALNQTGNSGRPLDQWLVKLGIINLEISKNIDSFQFPADAKLFVSLKSGAGG